MEEVEESASMKKLPGEVAVDIESAIPSAMRARIGHFKEQADSLTLEGVRRLLEKDLGLEKLALDFHKRFIKQCLDEAWGPRMGVLVDTLDFLGPPNLKCFAAAAADDDDENISKSSGEAVEEVVQSTREETKKLPEGRQQKEVKDPSSEDEEKTEGSPVLGLVAGNETQNETEEAGVESEQVPSEDTIKKAIKKRAAYIRANSEKISMVGARRLLEKDLNLDKSALDPYKRFISEQLDEVLKSPEVAESANGVKNKQRKKDSHSKAPRKVSSEESSDSLDSDNEEVDEAEVKPKKRTTPKVKTQNSEGLKRRASVKGARASSNKRSKPVAQMREKSSDEEDGHSQSSAEEPVKKREASTQVYGKHVEHLKSLIKSCGMSVPPSVYKRVKQEPESKREAYLIKELEEILEKEGLSTNPSEKEIKEVKKRKERTKELEGIDMSNIVSSSRRRSTYSFTPPPKLKMPVESGDEEDEESDDEDDDDDNAESSSEGTSEGFNEDEDESE